MCMITYLHLILYLYLCLFTFLSQFHPCPTVTRRVSKALTRSVCSSGCMDAPVPAESPPQTDSEEPTKFTCVHLCEHNILNTETGMLTNKSAEKADRGGILNKQAAHRRDAGGEVAVILHDVWVAQLLQHLDVGVRAVHIGAAGRATPPLRSICDIGLEHPGAVPSRTCQPQVWYFMEAWGCNAM